MSIKSCLVLRTDGYKEARSRGVMRVTFVSFSSLSELPECHVQIASNEECLDQLTCISLTPSIHVQLVAIVFLRVACTPSTHPSLAMPLLVRRLMDACGSSLEDGGVGERKEDLLMLRSALDYRAL